MPQDTPVKKNWFAEHKIATAIIGLSAFMVIGVALSEETGTPTTINKTESSTPAVAEKKENDDAFVIVNIDDGIDLSSFSMKVLGAREAATISSRYSSTAAKESAKFVILELQVTAQTISEFDFYPDETLKLIDSQGRQFTTYDDTIGNISDYLNVRTLNPGVPENGFIVYEIPETETDYLLMAMNKKTGDIRVIKFPVLDNVE